MLNTFSKKWGKTKVVKVKISRKVSIQRLAPRKQKPPTLTLKNGVKVYITKA